MTGPGTTGEPLDARRTTTLAAEVPAATVVRRIDVGAAAASAAGDAAADRWLGRPGRVRPLVDRRAAEVAAQARNVDLVYASMSPYESGRSPPTGSPRSSGVPWVADLRDPVGARRDDGVPEPAPPARELRRMRRLLRRRRRGRHEHAEAAARLVRALPRGRPRAARRRSRTASMPSDFDGPAAAADDDAFRIVHAGYLHTELGRGSARAGDPTAARRRDARRRHRHALTRLPPRGGRPS